MIQCQLNRMSLHNGSLVIMKTSEEDCSNVTVHSTSISCYAIRMLMAMLIVTIYGV